MQSRARQLLRIKNQLPTSRVASDALTHFFDNDLTTSAAAISYYTMLMLFPLLIVMISVGQSIVGAEEVRHFLVDRLLAFWPGTREFIHQNLEEVRDIPTGAVVTCWVLIFWALSWIFTVIEKAINRIWSTPPRRFLHGRLIALAMIGVMALLLMGSAVLTSAVSLLEAVAERLPTALPAGFEPITSAAWQISVVVISLVVTTALFGIIYKVMPNATVAWIEVVPGAVITGVAWEALRNGFAFLLPRFLEEYRLLYGGAWLALVLLTWTYMSSIVMLFGAQLTAVLHCRHEREDLSGSWPAPANDEACDPSVTAGS